MGLPSDALEADLFHALTNPMTLRYINTLAIVTPRGALRSNAPYAEEAAQAVNEAATSALTAFGNSAEDVLLGLEHQLRNLPVTVPAPGISSLLGRFTGRPAVVAGAGPSLALQFDLLRELQDEVLIVCADTSLKALRAQGIRPHIVTARERKPSASRHLVGVGDPGIWLCGLTVLHPECFEVWGGAHIAVDRAAGHAGWMAQGGLDKGVVDFQGSSGNMAFRLAQALGCDPIIMIGQDLAFGDDGRSHVAGTAHGFRQSRYDEMEVGEIPGNLQETVKSAPNWVRFLRMFEVDIARSEGLVMNATEGGARIRGAIVQTFPEAIDDHIPPSTRAAVRSELEALCKSSSRQDLLSTARSTLAHLAATRSAMTVVLEQCAQGAGQARRLSVELEPPAEVPAAFFALPPEVEEVRRLSPLRVLQELRLTVLGLPLFQEFVMVTASPVLMQWEVDSYALQRTCSDGGELLRALVPRYAEWFEVTAKLTQWGLDLLPWGEKALHEAFPELPPPTTPVPARTMLEIMAQNAPAGGPVHQRHALRGA